jgi:Flp pilus assembly protein TadG
MATVSQPARWGSERGAELIEMVVVLPLLMLVLFGIIDFGFMFQRYVVLTNAAMEGARVGILPSYRLTDAEARATSYASTGGVPGTVTAVATLGTITQPDGTSWPSVEVIVNHAYNYQFIGPIVSMFGGSFTSANLRARAVMRRTVP